MAISLMMDQHIPASITRGLRVRGVNVLTAFEDSAHQLPDEELLQRATELNHVLVTQDDDLLRSLTGGLKVEIPSVELSTVIN
tara:strand:+ start:2922 stop:3170 length:249 start_codon:yes stop_codon:yes gene_type:complete